MATMTESPPQISLANSVFANGGAFGQSVAKKLLQSDFDHNILRPYIANDGRSYHDRIVNGEKKTFIDNDGTLRKLEWELLDKAIIPAAKPRLKLVADLLQEVPYSLPNPMGTTTIQYQQQSDITEATLSLDGVRRSERDRPTFSLVNLPIPIIHKDFSYNIRELETSRRGGQPLDVVTAQLAARRVAEIAEQLAIGTISYSSGGDNVYGITNYPNRITYSITNPTGGGWTPANTIADVLAMQLASRNHYNFGPWKLYASLNFAQYLDRDVSGYYANKTLRTRLKEIEGITDIVTLDYLTGYQLVLVQMDANNIQMIKGSMPTMIQWEGSGGFEVFFKVFAILVPWLRSDKYGNCGIVHGS